jgi:hypothetical protein
MSTSEILGVLFVLGLAGLPLWCALVCLVLAAIIDGGMGSADSHG